MTEFSIERVEKELRGDASVNEVDSLRENPQLWADHLRTLMRRVDESILNKKSDALNQGQGNHAAIAAYANWKKGAVHFKSRATARLVEVKRLMPNKSDSIAPILEDILEELKYISSKLDEADAT